MLGSGTYATIAELAAAEKINESYVGREHIAIDAKLKDHWFPFSLVPWGLPRAAIKFRPLALPRLCFL